MKDGNITNHDVLVSAIIPLYNKALYIKRAIDSVLRQTYANFELIIVNDGSTDGGENIVRQFNDNRIRLIEQENKGPGAARNAGINIAIGEYLAFLDADDEWLPEYLERGITYLESAGDDIAAISFAYIDSIQRSKKVIKCWDDKEINDEIYEVCCNTLPEFTTYLRAKISPCTIMLRKGIVNKYGGFFDEYRCLYGEDSFLWLKVILNEKIAFSREVLVVIHSEASELSTNVKGCRPIEPFLIADNSLVRFCPIEKQELLGKILAIYAVNTAKYYSSFGLGKEGIDLLNNYCSNYKPDNYYKVKSYCLILPLLKPILPVARYLRHKLKGIKVRMVEAKLTVLIL